MKFKILLALLPIIFIMSCKNDKPTNAADGTKTAVKSDLFNVSFDLIIKKDDNMCLYYTEDGSVNFSDKNTIWVPVKGSENVQKVVFSFPEDVLPSTFRVDFGHGKNELQSDVALKKFKMTYQDKIAELDGTSIFTFFVPFDAYTKVIPGTSTLQRLTVAQDGGPIVYPLETLAKKITEITSGASPE